MMRSNSIPFQHKCLRRLLKIYWPMRVSNEEVHRRANTETISELIREKEDMDRARASHGQQLPPTSCSAMGTGRET